MLNKKHHISILIIFIIGGISITFSPQIKSMLASAVNFSISIAGPPQENQNNDPRPLTQNSSSSTNPRSLSKITFSGNNCMNGTVTLKIDDQTPKNKKTTSKGTFSITRSLKPATYNFEITCKNKDKKITKTILYEKIKLKKGATETISNINLAEKKALLKKPITPIKLRKPRLFKATLKNF